MAATFDARRFRASLRREAQAINERNRVPGDPHYKAPRQVVEKPMNCPDCKHKVHEPGQCSNCNCGESDISHAGSKPKPKPLRRPASSTLEPTVDKGRRVPKRKTDNA